MNKNITIKSSKEKDEEKQILLPITLLLLEEKKVQTAILIVLMQIVTKNPTFTPSPISYRHRFMAEKGRADLSHHNKFR